MLLDAADCQGESSALLALANVTSKMKSIRATRSGTCDINAGTSGARGSKKYSLQSFGQMHTTR